MAIRLIPLLACSCPALKPGHVPDVTCNPNDVNHDPSMWFNTCCFSNNFAGRYGTAGRDIIIGPPTHDFDFALLKSFPLGKEYRYLQFRSEVRRATGLGEAVIPGRDSKMESGAGLCRY
ncbi:MAG TPA: hypothetical protein VK604_06555 [Bryobacteraceae bacterium]|nr:hypothetical protein [Bryobacteraceae bacterium]